MTAKELRTRQGESEPMVVEFVSEFIDKLRKQLIADHKRWGNTWLNRPKEGQELRTKARYIDYFDMFEQAGTPVPWLKVVGGALICWIRENHPELCPDVNEVISEDMKKVGFELEDMCAHPELRLNADCEVCNVGGCDYDLRNELPKIETTKLEEATADEVQHKSDCAVYNEPAFPKSECDCQDCNLPSIDDMTKEDVVGVTSEDVCPISGEDSCATCKFNDCDKDQDYWRQGAICVDDVPVEEATTKELIESKRSIFEPRCVSAMSGGTLTNLKPVVHVHNETIKDMNRGTLEAPERIILSSIKFVCHSENHPDFVLAKCNEKGILVPNSRQVGIIGAVTNDGQYQFKAIGGVGPEDTLLVSYDYEYDLPK